MGHHDGPSTAFDDMKERPYGTVNPVGVPNLSTFHNIMVKSDEDNFPFKLGVLNQRQFRV